VFSMRALSQAFFECKDNHFREHVTFYFWQSEDKFRTAQYVGIEDWSSYRITVDYPEDLDVIAFLYREIESKALQGSLKEIIALLDENVSIKDINKKYYFGQGWR
ncbi:acylneuraminate cytidylyltransferase, partial [Candidatus Omnitrophota bacterium]